MLACNLRIFSTNNNLTFWIRNGANSQGIMALVNNMLLKSDGHAKRVFQDGNDIIILFPGIGTSIEVALSKTIDTVTQLASIVEPINGLTPIADEPISCPEQYDKYSEIIPELLDNNVGSPTPNIPEEPTQEAPSISETKSIPNQDDDSAAIVFQSEPFSGLKPSDVLKKYQRQGFWRLLKELDNDNVSESLKAQIRIDATMFYQKRLRWNMVNSVSRNDLQTILTEGYTMCADKIASTVFRHKLNANLSDLINDKDASRLRAAARVITEAITEKLKGQNK
jgi:hypothetical protein